MISPKSSYATVHWPISGGQDTLDSCRELIDLAGLEDTYRTRANEYAHADNYDYARRVIVTGSEIVDLAIRVVLRGSRPMAAEQMYYNAEDRAYVPSKQWSEAFDGSEIAHIPSELLEFLNSTWYKFAGEYALGIKLGYEEHRPKQS